MDSGLYRTHLAFLQKQVSLAWNRDFSGPQIDCAAVQHSKFVPSLELQMFLLSWTIFETDVNGVKERQSALVRKSMDLAR